ncbi:type II secretion system protein [Sideroxydans sp. CL21]|uniref:type II secretion system protein n=1 Tax=Sideroxydans sp. CL21 TaxID=2600596 RepID=UPI0024BD2465|nr:type II secretion system protein [Sideroxydans sp. CL21]
MSLKHTPLYCRSAGFTYIGLLILVAIMGVTLATIGTFWKTAQQRAKEQQLLFIGNQFSQAITAYNQNTPSGAVQFPKKLEDLVLDKRYLNTTRYLRKIFADPITGTRQWGLIKGADGGIVGVYSLSEIEPIKKNNFGRGCEAFAGKKHYSEWKFVYHPNGNALASAATPASPPPANPLPPAYQVPPVQPLPAGSTADPRKQNYCQITFSTDATICANIGAKFGAAAGATCMASARARNAICVSSDGAASMPPLAVQYQ